MYPWYDAIRMALHHWALSPKNMFHSLAIRKTSDKSQLSDIV